MCVKAENRMVTPDYKDNDIQIELIRFECGKITKVYDMQY